ncbi:class I SAM-dependent methyltransferase [Pseudohongiella sp.]|uniref:Methyltransferase regulatory domain-containing protein n=1 Tax=marine sediment metagenome TaxID=412755 RepID=A0A0F9VUN9_9ZZZZ|nr:class I SAM-dependent methyltransferase [Pseudohongiella sp.]HDZ08735.1 methyltransferase [Pseudohongiella sp.]HEA62351.1 methyltransferase [Pseudohongiella sp.]
MSKWSAGYTADVGYTFGYYTELNPLRIKFAFLNKGLVFPEVGTACELGFGQGLSATLHAAASITKWFGTDFNPAQASFAQELAAVSGAEARLYDESFEEFAARDELPEFEYIGLHGIWSWISDENRAIVVDFVRRKLKVGGVLYVSYNTLPGWGTFAPMRHLMTEHAEVIGAQGRGIVSRIDGAIEFADKLIATQPLFGRANPAVGDRITKLKGQNRHYLAHEFFNRDWHPMHFATMAEWLEAAKVTYACSAHYLDNIDTVNLSEEQRTFLNDIPNDMFRESVRDFMVNQQFRRDYWVKGARTLNALERAEVIREQRVILVTHRPDVSLKVTGAQGEAAMNEGIYNPYLDLMADHKPRTLAQIEQALIKDNINLGKIIEATLVLSSSGHIAPVQEERFIQKAKKHADKLNSVICSKARSSNDIGFLASPVTGGGVQVSRFNQMFMLAIDQGLKQPGEWANFAWRLLDLQGQKLLKDGSTLESAEENIAELTEEADKFAQKRLPALKALLIV